MRYLPEGRRFAITGVFLEIASKRSRSSGTPARRAMAIKWITELVEPPQATTQVTALSKEEAVRRFFGVASSQTSSTARFPVAVAILAWCESAAGIEAAPGSVRPSVSTADVMVEAVPMVMQ